MKKCAFFVFILAFLWISGSAAAKDYEVKKTAGAYTVHLRMDRNPPVAGTNTIEIGITDAAGSPVLDATVVVEYAMAAMPGMPAVSYKEKPVLKGEYYRGQVNFSMPGPWMISVKITRADKKQTVKFNVDVS